MPIEDVVSGAEELAQESQAADIAADESRVQDAMSLLAGEPEKDAEDGEEDAARSDDASGDGEGSEGDAEAGGDAKEAEEAEEAASEPSEEDKARDERLKGLEEAARKAQEARLHRQQRQAKEQQWEAERRELEGLRAERDAFQRQRDEFMRDPAAYYQSQGQDPREAYERFTKMALDPEGTRATDEVTRLRQEHEAFKEEVKREREQAHQARQAEAAKAAHESAKAQFSAHSKSEKYPLLSRLDDDERVEWGVGMAQALQSAGIAFDDAVVAQYVEDKLQSMSRKWGGSPEDGKQQKTTKPAGRGRTRPDTLTKATATETASSPESDTEEDLVRAATQMLESRR